MSTPFPRFAISMVALATACAGQIETFCASRERTKNVSHLRHRVPPFGPLVPTRNTLRHALTRARSPCAALHLRKATSKHETRR